MKQWERILLNRMRKRVSETSYYMGDAPSGKILGQFGRDVEIKAYTDVSIIIDPHVPPPNDLLKRIFDFLPQCNSTDRPVPRTIRLVHEHIGGTPYKKTVRYTWGPRISRKIAEDMLAHIGCLDKNATVEEIFELQILRKLHRISSGIFFFLSGRELDEDTGEKIKRIFSDLSMKNAWAIHTDSSKPMADENIWIINWKNQIFGTPLKRRSIEMSSNFVDIIGFQLEKVHTGMIQWMLEADQKIVSDADKCKILNELTGNNSNFTPP